MSDGGARREAARARRARDVMTPDPACCTTRTTLDQVAKMMIQNDCGEIPVIDLDETLVGVITDRDIVCRVVAEGKNPGAHTAEHCMTQPVIALRDDTPLDELIATLEKHQIRRVPIVDQAGRCIGIVSQADIAWAGDDKAAAGLLRQVSRDSSRASR